MADTNGQPQRKRARQACLACNSRRVKCNVTEQQPCENCLTANVPCETRESRRGKHPRPSKKHQSEEKDVASSSSSRGPHADEVAASHALASLHRNRPSDALNLNHDVSTVESYIQTDSEASPRTQDPKQEDDGDVFLGESTALRYVQDEPISATQRSPAHSVRLRHSVPNAARAEALIPNWEVERRERRLEHLKMDGAFTFPEPDVVEGLLKGYFRWFHPCFAVVDEMDVWHQYGQGTLSPLLLQAMLFIGILHCDEDTLIRLALGTRHRAKYVFYSRAKDLYDAEFETKKLTVIQALFLMSFWRAGALLEKDTRHWLSAAISLAQTKGLHRSAGKAESKVAKLRRRVWWAIYTRDRQCAAALGLPNRVRDEDSDFEYLEMSDFDHAFHPSIPQKEAHQYASYSIAMTELAKILGRIVHSGYLPNTTLSSSHRAQMRDDLIKWKQRLPPAMQPDGDLVEQPGFYANMQHLAYNNLLILLYRQGFIGIEEGSRDIDGNVALQAASRNSKIIEDMLSEGDLRHGQIHVITNLFNTLCIHTVHLQKTDGTARSVAEHRAKLCLLGLRELQKTWEVTNWVLQLFFSYLDRATAARLRVQQEDDSALNTGARTSREATVAPAQVALPPGIVDALVATIPGADSMPPSSTDLTGPGTTPWSWTSEEANQFLFSQIEQPYSFGEGEMLEWSPQEAALNNALIQPNDMGINPMPYSYP